MSPRRLILATSILALVSPFAAKAQDSLTWTGAGADGKWSTSGNWNPFVPNGNDILNFAGTTNLDTTNDLAGYGGYQILFNTGAGAFTLGGNGITLFDFGGNAPKIENDSTSLQTINLNLTLDGTNGGGFSEINPVNGDLAIGGTVTIVDGQQLRIWGNNGKTVTFSNVISGAGSTLAINQNSTVVFTAANTYSGDTFVNAGTLRFDNGGSAAGSLLQLGDLTGTANATIALGVTAGGQTLGNAIVVRAGSTGGRTIQSLNTAGTNTLSGPITLNTGLTLDTASGGTLTLSGAVSGTGALTKTGGGILSLNGASANTFTGTTEVTAGTLTLGKTAGVNAIGGDLKVSGSGVLAFGANNQLPDTTSVLVTGGNFSLSDKDETFASLTVTGGSATSGTGAGNGGTATLTGTLSVNGGAFTLGPGANWTANKIALGSNISLDGTGTRQSQLIVGSGGLELTGAAITIGGGSLGSKVVLNGNVTTLASATQSSFSLGSGTNRQVDLNGGVRTFNIADGAAATDFFTDAGLIGGAGSGLIKTGPGTMLQGNIGPWSFTGTTGGVTVNDGTLNLTMTTNSFTGPITVNGTGVLAYTGQGNADPTALGGGAKTITLTNGGTLRPTSNSDPNSGGNKVFSVGAGGGTIDTPSGVAFTLNDASQWAGAGLAIKTGAGQLILGQASTGYAATRTGNLQIDGGAVYVGHANGVGASTATVTVNAGGAIGSNTSATIANPVTVAQSGSSQFGQLIAPGANTLFGGTLTIPAGVDAVANVADYNNGTASGTNRIIFTSGLLSGAGNLIINGPTGATRGVLTINNTSSDFSGTITINKSVSVENLARFSGVGLTAATSGKTLGTATFVFGSGGTGSATPQLDLRDNGDGSNSQAFAYNNNLIATANGGNIVVSSGSLTGGAALFGKFQLGSLQLGAQTLTVSGSSNYSVEFTGATTLSGAATISPSTTGGASASDITLSGAVSGAFDLNKGGNGILTLANANNAFGGAGKTIAISAGTLAVGSNGALGNSANAITITGGASAALRATGSFSTDRAITLSGNPVSTNVNGAIDVVGGQTLTLSTALSSGAASSHLGKIGAGTLASSVTSGTPFGAGNISINAGGLALTPGGSGQDVALTGANSGEVSRLTTTNSGAGYTSAPTLTISAPGSGVTATATATFATGGTVSGTSMTLNGSGYTSLPTVTPSGGGTPTTPAAFVVSAMNQFTYDKNASLVLAKGQNNSLTYTVGVDFAPTNSTLNRGAVGATLTLVPTALANLGNTTANGGERFIVNGGVNMSNSTVTPSIVAVNSPSDSTATFVTYDATNGFKPASYAAATDINLATATTNFDATTDTSLSANRSANAIRVGNGVTVGGSLGTALTLTNVINPSFTGNQAGVILNGGSLTVPTITPTSNGEMIIYTSAANGSISSAITGTGSTVKFGPGTLTISGSLPTGAVHVNDGVLAAGTVNALNGQSVQLNTTGASLDLRGYNQIVGNLTTPVPLGMLPVVTTTSGPATLTLNLTGASTFSGVLQDGAGGGVLSLQKVGTNTLTLNTPNTYSGSTGIHNGQVTVTNSGTLGSGDVQITGAGKLAVVSMAAINSAATLSMTAVDGAWPTLILGNNYVQPVAAGSSGVIAIDAGYSQAGILAGTTLFLGANSAQTYNGGSLTAGANSTLRLGGGGNTLTVSSTNALTGANTLLVGVPAGTGGLTTVNGTGTVNLTGAQNFSGATTVSQGSTLTLSGGGGTALSSPGFTVNGGTLLLNNDAGTNVSTGNNNSRIADTASVTLNHGVFQLQGPNVTAAGTNVTEQIGALTYTKGSTVKVNIQGGGSFAILKADSLTRGGVGDTLTLTTQTNGQLTGTASSVSQFLISGATKPAVSGTGGSGSGIVSPSIVNGTDNTYVTYNATTGFANATYSTATLSTSTATDVLDASAGGAIATTANAYAVKLGTTALTGGTITVASGGVLFNGTATHTTNFALGGEGLLYASSGVTARLDGDVSAGALTKFGAGQVNLNNAAAKPGLAGKTVYINSGVLGLGIDAVNQTSQLPTDMRFVVNLGGTLTVYSDQTIAGISGNGLLRIGNSANGATAKTLTINNNQNDVFAGAVQSAANTSGSDVSIVKGGSGSLTFNGGFQLARTLQVNFGEFILAGGAAQGQDPSNADRQLLNVQQGGVFTLDNTQQNNLDRLRLSKTTANSGYINLNGGTFNFLGSSLSASSEYIGNAPSTGSNTENVRFNAGMDVVNVVAGTGQSALLNFKNSLTRSAGASVLFRGTNLGGAVNTANSSTVQFTTLPALTSNATPTTALQTGVIKGVFVDSVIGGVDTYGIATYDRGANGAIDTEDVGIRRLLSSEQAATITDGDATTLNNVLLSSTQTLASASTVNALHLAGGSVSGAALTINSGTLLAANNGATGANAINTSGLTFTGGEAVIHTASDLTIGAPITGTTALTKSGAATLALTSAGNTFTGSIIVNGGLLSVDGNDKLGNSANTVTLNNGGGLQITGSVALETGAAKRGIALGAAGGVVDVPDGVSAAVSGVISGGLGTISGGISGSTGVIAANTTVFTKTGAGALLLSGVNTFTGRVEINGGALAVGGSLGANANVAVNNGGTLGGTGTIAGAVAVNSGGTFAPGNSPGILNTGSLAFNTGSIFSLELNGTTAGSGYDQANVTGSVSLNGPVALSLSVPQPFADFTSFTLINNDGNDAVAFADSGARFTIGGSAINEGDVFAITGGFGTQRFQISYAGGTGNDVVLTAVPEPGSTSLLLGAVGSLAGLRRFRRRKA